MEAILQHFLVRFRYCPLPGIGQLIIRHQPAVLHFTENMLTAPVDRILLVSEMPDQQPLIDWIQSEGGMTAETARQLVGTFAQSITNLTAHQSITFGVLGAFIKDAAGRIQFNEASMPDVFTPSVALKRVIHPNAIHSVRVGDKESTNAEMTERLHETVELKKPKWWVAAVLLVLIATLGMVYYLNLDARHTQLGNATSIQVKQEPITFTIAD